MGSNGVTSAFTDTIVQLIVAFLEFSAMNDFC